MAYVHLSIAVDIIEAEMEKQADKVNNTSQWELIEIAMTFERPV